MGSVKEDERWYTERTELVSDAEREKFEAEQRVKVVDFGGSLGHGVVANRDLHKGEVIDRAPLIIFKRSDLPGIETPEKLSYVGTYVWRWSGQNDVPEGHPDELLAVACGKVSILNHSYDPNIGCVRNRKDQMIEMFALQDIKKGEELRWNYNGNPADKSPLWFPVV